MIKDKQTASITTAQNYRLGHKSGNSDGLRPGPLQTH